MIYIHFTNYHINSGQLVDPTDYYTINYMIYQRLINIKNDWTKWYRNKMCQLQCKQLTPFCRCLITTLFYVLKPCYLHVWKHKQLTDFKHLHLTSFYIIIKYKQHLNYVCFYCKSRYLHDWNLKLFIIPIMLKSCVSMVKSLHFNNKIIAFLSIKLKLM